MKEKLIIVGTSSTAKHVYEFICGYDLFDVVGFAVDTEYRTVEKFCDLPVFALETLDKVFEKRDIKLFVAVLWNRLNADRRKLYERLKNEGYYFANLVSPTAVIRGTLLGDNCWIHDFVVIQPEAEIGADTILMAFSLVGHDVKLGSHCFCGTKSTIAGGCYVGEQTFIGINCTIFDDTIVGEKCILGACTVVKRNVESFSIIKTDINNMVVKQMEEKDIEEKLLFKKNIR